MSPATNGVGPDPALVGRCVLHMMSQTAHGAGAQALDALAESGRHREWVRVNIVVAPSADGPLRVATNCAQGLAVWTCAICGSTDPCGGEIERPVERLPAHITGEDRPQHPDAGCTAERQIERQVTSNAPVTACFARWGHSSASGRKASPGPMPGRRAATIGGFADPFVLLRWADVGSMVDSIPEYKLTGEMRNAVGSETGPS